MTEIEIELLDRVRQMFAGWRTAARTEVDASLGDETDFGRLWYWRGRAYAYEECEAHLRIALQRITREEIRT
jgi:hypothetical protein